MTLQELYIVGTFDDICVLNNDLKEIYEGIFKDFIDNHEELEVAWFNPRIVYVGTTREVTIKLVTTIKVRTDMEKL